MLTLKEATTNARIWYKEQMEEQGIKPHSKEESDLIQIAIETVVGELDDENLANIVLVEDKGGLLLDFIKDGYIETSMSLKDSLQTCVEYLIDDKLGD